MAKSDIKNDLLRFVNLVFGARFLALHIAHFVNELVSIWSAWSGLVGDAAYVAQFVPLPTQTSTAALVTITL